MPIRDFTYIPRIDVDANKIVDAEIVSRLRMGEYIQVSAPPQTGKTWLAQAVKKSLDDQELSCSLVSLRKIEISNDPNLFGSLITRHMAESLGITEDNNLYREFFSAKRREKRKPGLWLTDFCNEVLSGTIPFDNGIVFIFDDVDSIFDSASSEKYPQDFIYYFFKQIENFYTRRKSNNYSEASFYKRLSVLSTYSYLDLSQYTDLSFVDIGYSFKLGDFDLKALLANNEVLQWCMSNSVNDKALVAIHEYTSGHPALTATLLKDIQDNIRLELLVENLIKNRHSNILKFLNDVYSVLDKNENLLNLYKRVLDGEEIFVLSLAEQSKERDLQQRLLSLGMVIEKGGKLIVRNSIFQKISHDWPCIQRIGSLESSVPITDPRHMLSAGITDGEQMGEGLNSVESLESAEAIETVEDITQNSENDSSLSESDSHNNSPHRNHRILNKTSIIIPVILFVVLSIVIIPMLPNHPLIIRVLGPLLTALFYPLAFEFVLGKKDYWNALVNSLRGIYQRFNRFIRKPFTAAFATILSLYLTTSFLVINYHQRSRENDLIKRSEQTLTEFVRGESREHIKALEEAIDIYNSAQGIRLFQDLENHGIPIVSLALQYIHFKMNELDRYKSPGLEKLFHLAVSLDGKVAAGGESRSSSIGVNDFVRDDWIVIWNSSGKIILQDTLGSRLRHVSFSSNGKLVAVITEDNRVRLFSIGEGLNQKISTSSVQSLTRDRTASSQPRHVTFTTDNQYLAVAKSDGYIDVWRLGNSNTVTDNPQLSLPYSSSNQEIDKVKLAANSQCLIATANNQIMAWSIPGFTEGRNEPSDVVSTHFFSPNDIAYAINDNNSSSNWIAIAGQKFFRQESNTSQGIVEIRKTSFDGKDCRLVDEALDQEAREKVIEGIKNAVVSISIDINYQDDLMRLLLMTDNAEVSRYEIPLNRIEMISEDGEIEPNYSISTKKELTQISSFNLRPSNKAEDAYHNFIKLYNDTSNPHGIASQFVTYSPGVKDDGDNSSFIQVWSLQNQEENSQQVVRGRLYNPVAIRKIIARRNRPNSQNTIAVLYEIEMTGDSSKPSKLIAFCGNDLQNCRPLPTDRNIAGFSSFDNCVAIAEKVYNGSTIRFLNWSNDSSICREDVSLDRNYSLIDIKSLPDSSTILMATSKNVFIFDPKVDQLPLRLQFSSEVSNQNIEFNRIKSIDMSTNEKYLGIYADGFLKIFENPHYNKTQNPYSVEDVAKQIGAIEINQPRDFQFYSTQNRADNLLISLSQDGNKVEFWQMMDTPNLAAILTLESQNQKLASIPIEGSWNKVLAYSAEEQTYLVVAGDYEILVWDLSDIVWKRNGFNRPIRLEDRLVAAFQEDWGGKITSLDVLDGNDIVAGTENGALVKLKVRNSSFSRDLLIWGCEWLSEYHARETAVAPRARYSLSTTTQKVNRICQKYLSLS